VARGVDGSDASRLADFRFTLDDLKQLEYAALLHDFGKVGVREHVLVKARKLYDHERQRIADRWAYIAKALEAEHLRARLSTPSAEWPALERALEERLRELAGFGQLIDRANQPAPLESASEAALRALAARRYRGIDGQEQPYLSAEELNALAIPRGSLTAAERSEIESHVVHTYNFLQKIPWGRQ